MKFEFTDSDLEVIEKLQNYNLKEDTKKDIMSFLERYRFRKRFYEVIGEYIRLTKIKGFDKLVTYLKVTKVEEKENSSKPIILRTNQTIMYSYTDDDVIAYSGVSTRSRLLLEKYPNEELDVKIEIDPDFDYTIEVISQDEYENELVNAVNIN